ncbi:MAG: hypothetical protein AB1847_11240 [bacterium]
MKGYPKYFNSKQDIINVIRADLDPEMTKSALQALLNTAKRREPVWPEGCDPENPETLVDGQPVQPIDWTEVDNPGGSIFLIGLDVTKVNSLIETVDAIQPFLKQLVAMSEMVQNDEIEEIEDSLHNLSVNLSLDLDNHPDWMPDEIFFGLIGSGTESLVSALVNPNRDIAQDTAGEILNALISQVQGIIDSRLNV